MIPALQRLDKGKILTGKNFPTYVDTHNYLVDVAENIKGDYDIDARQGFVEYDTTVPNHPVIRLKNVDKLAEYSSAEISVQGDADDDDNETKSIQSYDLSSSPRTFELYKFNDLNYKDVRKLEDIEIVSRDGDTLKYTHIELSSLSNSLSGINTHLEGDSNIQNLEMSSVSKVNPDPNDPEKSYYQLFGWTGETVPDELSTDAILIRRNKILRYLELSNMYKSRHCGDVNLKPDEQKSIVLCAESDQEYYQLNDFEKPLDETSVVINIGYAKANTILSNELIERKYIDDVPVVSYHPAVTLSVPDPTPAVSVDADVSRLKQRSVEHFVSNDVVLQIFDFDDGVVDDENVGGTAGTASTNQNQWYDYCHRYYGDSDGYSPISAAYRLKQYANGCYNDAEIMHRNTHAADGGREVKYDTMDVVLPTYVRCDYDMGCGFCGPNPFGCTSRSLQMRFMNDSNKSYREKYYELYNFSENIAYGDGTLTAHELTWADVVNPMSYVADGNEYGCFERPIADNAFGQDEDAQFVMRSTDKQSFATCISYQKLYEKLPPFIRPDTILNSQGYGLHNTLEIKNTGYATFSDTYWQLYNWGCDNGKLTVDLSSKLTADVGQKILMVSQDGKSLEYHDISFIAPECTVVEQDIYEITQGITNIWDSIYDISGLLSGDLSAYWIKGGDYTDNWGTNIGYGCPGASQAEGIAIGLTNKTLYSDWKVTGNLAVQGCALRADYLAGYTGGNFNHIDMRDGKIHFGCGVYVESDDNYAMNVIGDLWINSKNGCGGTLYLNGTDANGCDNAILNINGETLNASQLRQLKALIS